MNTGFWSNEEPDSDGPKSSQKAIVCPEGQDKFCVKQEVNGLAKTECGMTEYFGDKYEIQDNGDLTCVLKKCASTCLKDKLDVHSDYIEEFRERSVYTRDTLCCTENYCNAASSRAVRGAWGVLALGVVLLWR